MTDQEINEAVYKKLGWDATPQTFIPHYCTSIAAAWEIAEYLKAQKRCKGLALYSPFENESQWSFKILWLPYIFEALAETAPMAICLAFLKLDEQKH